MKPPGRLLVAAGALLAVAVVLVAVWRREAGPPAAGTETDAESGASGETGPGRLPPAPDADWLAAARARMISPRESWCGPYALLADGRHTALESICEAVGSRLEAVYIERLGLRPRGEPRGAILLFGDLPSFRRFAVEVAGLRAGYAGFSRAARSLVALHAAHEPRAFATTLAHELTHLVHRRALGPDARRWLSEGLADAVGDPATEAGIGPLVGLTGVEAQAARLAAAYEAGRELPIARLTSLERRDFDRETISLDYEQSALLVRMLLLDPDLGQRFRAYLRAIAAGEIGGESDLAGALGTSWPALDERFRRWLRHP